MSLALLVAGEDPDAIGAEGTVELVDDLGSHADEVGTVSQDVEGVPEESHVPVVLGHVAGKDPAEAVTTIALLAG